MSGWKALDRFRIHESAEVKTKNLATRWDVVQAVIVQQIVQVVLGWWWLGGSGEEDPAPLISVPQLKDFVLSCATLALGEKSAAQFFAVQGPGIVWFLYWWGIPAVQLLVAM